MGNKRKLACTDSSHAANALGLDLAELEHDTVCTATYHGTSACIKEHVTKLAKGKFRQDYLDKQLHFAATHLHLQEMSEDCCEKVELYLKYGADPNYKGMLFDVIKFSRPRPCSMPQCDCMVLLLKYGASTEREVEYIKRVPAPNRRLVWESLSPLELLCQSRCAPPHWINELVSNYGCQMKGTELGLAAMNAYSLYCLENIKVLLSLGVPVSHCEITWSEIAERSSWLRADTETRRSNLFNCMRLAAVAGARVDQLKEGNIRWVDSCEYGMNGIVTRVPSLMSLARAATRNCMISANPHTNLFCLVPSAPLPASLKGYLVYDMVIRVDLHEIQTKRKTLCDAQCCCAEFLERRRLRQQDLSPVHHGAPCVIL